MSTIDRAALIEQAAGILADRMTAPRVTDVHRNMVREQLPVVAKALLAPLREMHPMGFNLPWGIPICTACDCIRPCPTVRLLDAIEAEVQP